MLGPLLGRPSEDQLTALARKARPAPPIEVPAFGPDHLALGRAAFAEGRYGDALHHFGQLLEVDPESPWAWHGRGDALQLMDEHAGALAAYERAAALAPRTGLHHAGRANALHSLGRTDEAEAAREEALRLDPEVGRLWREPAGGGA